MTIRGKTIAFASHKKREREKWEKELEKNLENLYVTFNENPTEIIRQNIDVNETELKKLREETIKGLIIRAKAKWQVEGEKSTNYCCNLEKRHFTEKLIPKLIVENNEITDLSQIIKEQANFYKSLYSANKNTSHTHDKTNPFFNFLIEDDKHKYEGAFSKEECLKALKNMKNNKTPGLNGFTSEFYKIFWNDVYIYLVRSLNTAGEVGHLSISQMQGVITCIPKEDRSKFYLKNWRPISLLNVDQKIGSSVIVNRIKQILDKLISSSQKGFLKGLYIGECTRLIFDLIERAEEENIPGILLLLDFEKAFDTVEWSFLLKTLDFFGFGKDLCNWVKTFYTDQTSCILNNGHCSDFFDITKESSFSLSFYFSYGNFKRDS